MFADAKKWNGSLYAGAPDKAEPAHTTSAATAPPAETDPSAKITEGEYEVWFGAQDKLDQLNTTTPITVVYDTADPTATLKVSTDGGTNYNSVGELYVKEGFKVKVGGSDTNGVTDIKLELKKDDPAVTTWTPIVPTTATATSLSERAYDVAFTAPNDAQGAYTLRAIVTDKAGKQAVATCSVIYDTKEPSLTVPELTPALNDVLQKMLTQDTAEYGAETVSVLGEIGGDEEAAFLASYFDSLTIDDAKQEVILKQTIMAALEKLHSEDTRAFLLERAQDENENIYVRSSAVAGLAQMGNSDIIPLLTEFFEQPEPQLREAAIRGSASFDTDETRKLILQGF